MPQQIDVPGQGVIEFPDEMEDEQIKGVIKRKFFSPQASPDQGLIQTSMAPINEAYRMMQMGALATPDKPQPDYQRIAAMAGGGAVAGPPPPVALDQLLGQLAQRVPAGQNPLTRAASSVAKTGLGFAAGAVAPENLIAETLLPTPAAPLAAGYFGYQMGKGALEGGQEVYRQFQKPGQLDQQATLDAIVGTAAMGLGAGEIGYRGVGALRDRLYRPITKPSEPEITPSLSQPVAPPTKPAEVQPVVEPRKEVPPVVQGLPAPPPAYSLPHPELLPVGVAPLELPPIGSVQVQPPPQIGAQRPESLPRPRPKPAVAAPPVPPAPIDVGQGPALALHGQAPIQPTTERKEDAIQVSEAAPVHARETPSDSQAVGPSVRGESPQVQEPQKAVTGTGGVPAIRVTPTGGAPFVVTGKAHSIAAADLTTKNPMILDLIEAGKATAESGWQLGDGSFVTERPEGATSVSQPPLESQADLQSQLSEELGPQEEPELTGPRMVQDLNRLRLSPDKEGRYEGTQLLGTLRNKLHPAEYEAYKQAGIEQAFQGKKVSGQEVAKWMQEKGPRVEVRKSGEGGLTPEQKERADLQHWYDTFPSFKREMVDRAFDPTFGERDPVTYLKDRGFNEEELRRAIRLNRLRDVRYDENAAHWQSVAPKPEGEMPGYVEGFVRLPEGKYRPDENKQHAGILFPGNTHTGNIPNVLGWFRGYMETRPDGGKTFHVVEVQSDWAQQIQRDLKKYGEQGLHESDRYKSHPLLKDWERLTLKAAIDHARKEGADRIAVSDAETAMMTEGHDRVKGQDIIAVVKTKEEADRLVAENPNRHAVKTFEAGLGESYRILEDKGIIQEPGMRLHYDTILPRTLSELTGEKGKKVEFGEHKMALENIPAGQTRYDEARFRKDLIFKTPTGEPKTSISATEFSLKHVSERQEPFSLFGRDKIKGQFAPQEAPEKAPEEPSFKPGSTGHEAVSQLASQGNELAKFLSENYEHVLRTVKIGEGTGRSQRANYDPLTHTMYLGEGGEFRVLEEAAHAATFWQFEHPQTETQIQAVRDIQAIREESAKRLEGKTRDLIGQQKSGLPYRHSSDQEFIAGMFSDPELRQHLSSFSMGPETAWERFKDAVKRLLGIKPQTALDDAMDAVAEVGQEGGGINEARAKFKLDPVSAPQVAPAVVVHDAVKGEAFERTKNKLRGAAFPSHLAADPETANKLVAYASARIAAPESARWMATDVLGSRWRDKVFDKQLGATLVEDRLRAVKKSFNELADKETDPQKKAQLRIKAAAVTSIIGHKDSPFKSEQAFQRALQNPEIKAAIERHKSSVQAEATQKHQALGGEMAQPGEDTDAFVNLRAIFADDVETARGMIFGSRKGDLTAPLKRGSVFSKHAKGTAQAYDLSYRNIAERMIRGNYEQFALQDYYKDLVAKGLAVEKAPGVGPQKTEKGEPLEKITIEIRGGGPGRTRWKNLWVRKDLAPELRQALSVDQTPTLGWLEPLMKAATSIQIIGPTDIAFHMVNQLGTISGMQGAGPVWYDVLRKGTPVGTVDAVARVAYHGLRSMVDSPEFQKEIADISKIGAGRAKPVHQGLTVAGHEVPIASTLNHITAGVIRFLDKGSRIAANRMFDELVRRGWETDKPENRREFINNMGQYNGRMMGKLQQIARDSSLSSFVVAGTQMNRNALRRVLASPLVRAADPESWAKMRMVEIASLASMLFAIPYVFNYINTGTIYGRAGTPFGMIDRGKPKNKDGTHDVFDPLQMNLTRRGLRGSGAQALYTGVKEDSGAGRTVHNMVRDIFAYAVHPMAGPPVRFAYTAATGRELGSGYLVSRNPESFAQNLLAAAKNVNPVMVSILKSAYKGMHGESPSAEEGKPWSRLLGAAGIKQSRRPTTLEEANELSGGKYESLPLAQKRRVMQRVESERKERPVDESARRAAGVRAFWDAYAEQDALKAALPKEQQSWLEKNQLSLPGFKSELTFGKVRLPATKEDHAFMEKAVATEYQKQIDRLMHLPAFERQSVQKKQERLALLLTLARKRARVALRRREGGAQPSPALPDTSPIEQNPVGP